MSACPVCGKAVDPLRAPAVAVVGGKVVSFCSKEHAASAATDSRPVTRKDATPIPKKRDATPIPSKKTRTPPAGVTTPASLLDSGPVIEIIHEPASGVVTSAPDARSGPSQAAADRAETSGAIEIAETGHLDDYVSQDEPRRSRGWLALLVLVVLGGGAFAAYQLGYLDAFFDSRSHAATTTLPHPASDTSPAPAPPPVTTLAAPAAVDAARGILHAAITAPSSSSRVQRLAAAALARTGASEAVVPLIAALPKETSNTARLDIYYALARGADRRGTDGLVASLASSSRDDKLDAARRLAMLGDKRATAALTPYLDVAGQRLGAAESLAYLADPRAIQTLEQILADASSSAADKAEAAVALGIAGKSSAAPALRALLTDPHFNAFAATALAELHDSAAKPVLTKQLDVPALRVEAARGLRRLDPSIDATALLPKLVADARAATGAEQVQAAEAVLVLAGPPAWSERP